MPGVVFWILIASALVWGAPTGPSSEPYLSGDTWRHHVEHILSDVESFEPEKVEPGDTIFVEQDSLDDFYRQFVPKIRSPFILITANCDRGGDEPMPGRYERLLDVPFLHAWFTQNLDRSNHPKLFPIPIGLANRKWRWGMIELYEAKIPEARNRERRGWVYVNFSINTNPKIRKPAWDFFSQFGSMAHLHSFKDHSLYMDELPNHIFVASPPGNGLDCHRTWEALLLGSYPIVLSSTLDPLYKDLPILVLKKWEELTPELLRQKYKEFKCSAWNYDKLYFPYWLNEVKKVQSRLHAFNQGEEEKGF